MLLSFERPAAGRPSARRPSVGPTRKANGRPRCAPRRTLKTAQLANESQSRGFETHLGITELSRERPQLSVAGTPKRAQITVKILRAHGGCLGIRSRRRAWTTAISHGEVLNSL